MNEADTCRTYVVPKLQKAGWESSPYSITEQRIFTNPKGRIGWFASPEYRTFTCISDECDPGYLSHLVATAWFRKQLASATRGVGARRKRLRPEMLLGLRIPFPEYAQQMRAVAAMEKLKASKQFSHAITGRKDALMPSLLDRIFNESGVAL